MSSSTNVLYPRYASTLRFILQILVSDTGATTSMTARNKNGLSLYSDCAV